VWIANPCYFITACVAGRCPLLANDEAFAILLDEWSQLRGRRGWAVGRFVVMPDHVHFFTTPTPDCAIPLSDAIGRWKEWTAKRILRGNRRPAPLWQPEFFDHVLRTAASREQKWRYVRENPVRARLAATAEAWPYSGRVDFE